MAPDDGKTWPGARPPASRPLIERYQEVARLSREMLAAAHREDWEQLARLEAGCRILIEQLKRAARTEPLGAVEQQHRIELLREILQADAQIRSRAEPWLQELERLLGTAARPAPPD